MSVITSTRPARCEDCIYCTASIYFGKNGKGQGVTRYECMFNAPDTKPIRKKDKVCDNWEIK